MKNSFGSAFMMFGILLVLIDLAGGIRIPVIEELPWKGFGLISGIWGLVLAVKNSKQD